MKIKEYLQKHIDKIYKSYCKKSVFTNYKIIGVRNNKLKRYAKTIIKKYDLNDYLSNTNFNSFDEMQLYIHVLNELDDYDLVVKNLKIILKIIDNWCSCDTIRPKCFDNNLDKVEQIICEWIESSAIYEKRFGILCFIRYFSSDTTKLEKIFSIKSQEYYVNMARAWYFTELLSNNFDETFNFLKIKKLDNETLSMMFQKISYSAKISAENKILLKDLRK